jgi:hypothetical protein
MCLYCGDPANEVDHIIPHSYSLDNREENLVASCTICNRIASDKVFDGFIAKQTHIREERAKDKWTEAINLYRSICQYAGLPLPIVRQAEDKPEKESKPKRRRNLDGSSVMKKPPLPPVYDPPEPEKVEELPRKERKKRLQGYRTAVAPAFDYSNIQAYQTMFIVKHQKGNSWRKIAVQHGLHPNMARLIANGHEPGNRIREKLKLPPIAEVVSLNEGFKDGSQVIGAVECCVCGQWFVSNHPKRKRCFICTPFRSRK